MRTNVPRALFPLAFCPLLLPACTHDRSYAYAQATSPEGDPTAIIALGPDASIVSLGEGSAASAHIQLVAKDGELISGSLQVTDPTMLSLQTATSDPQRYVFLGVRPGTTNMTITVNGAVVAAIPATVIAPPPFTPPAWLTGADDAGSAGTDGGDAGVPGDAASDSSDGG
jgi:hypothetical protein